MTRVLQISDAHFGRERSEVVDALVALHAELQPDIVVLSGDLTQRATDAEFRATRAFTDRLAGSELLSLAGNHDIPLYAIWTRLLAPYSRYREHFGSEAGFVRETDSLQLIGINSARHLKHKDGEIDRDQREQVARLISASSDDKLQVVVLHHPVHAIRPQDEQNVVHGGEAAVRAWSAAGADLIVGGHIHLPYLSPLSQRYARLPRGVWSVQAGTATSDRTRGGVPNSVNLIETGTPSACHVERWDFEAGGERFWLHSRDDLALGLRVPVVPTGLGAAGSGIVADDHPP